MHAARHLRQGASVLTPSLQDRQKKFLSSRNNRKAQKKDRRRKNLPAFSGQQENGLLPNLPGEYRAEQYPGEYCGLRRTPASTGEDFSGYPDLRFRNPDNRFQNPSFSGENLPERRCRFRSAVHRDKGRQRKWQKKDTHLFEGVCAR